mgnify:CR=1 FL=1
MGKDIHVVSMDVEAIAVIKKNRKNTMLLGVGMCLCMVFAKMVIGIAIGIIGIVVLLMLIPLLRGLHD